MTEAHVQLWHRRAVPSVLPAPSSLNLLSADPGDVFKVPYKDLRGAVSLPLLP